jgi:hypothetical protein
MIRQNVKRSVRNARHFSCETRTVTLRSISPTTNSTLTHTCEVQR